MANTSKNGKQAASKKKNLCKNSSDQKENRPKKVKIMKSDLNDSISMSKQLMKKKSVRKISRPKRKVESTKRILPNGKLMPSLTDLEKMYEEFDDDVEDHKPTSSKDQQTLKCSSQESSSILERQMTQEVTDLLFSPKTRNRIGKQVKNILNKSSSNRPDDVITTSPPRKRFKFLIQSDEFSYLPPVNESPEKKKNSNSDLSCVEDQNKTTASNILVEPKEKVKRLVLNDGNESDNSLNSNKTIEYNLGPPKLQSESISEAFCPLPSTSRDDKIFSKNDELFLETLKEINNNLPNENSVEQEVAEDNTATIVIDDEIMEEPLINTDDIQITDSTDLITTTTVRDTIKRQNYCEDDDCIIVDTCNNTSEMTTNRPDIIDLEYNFIKPETEVYSNTADKVDDEIIDVDALIAENQLIINKYNNTDSKTLGGTNLVIDVDISTIEENTNNQRESQTTYENQPTTNETHQDVTSSTYVQNQTNDEYHLEQISDIQTQHDSSIPYYNQSHAECEIVDISHNANVGLGMRQALPHQPIILQNHNRHLFTQNEVSYFFTSRYYNPYDNVFSSASYVDVHRSQNLTSTPHERHSAPKAKQSNPKATINQGHPTSPGDQGKSGDSHSKSSGILGDCPICMEKLSGNVIGSTICGHVFCMSCLEKAINIDSNKKRCPTCRKVLKNKGYHKIFL